MAPSAATTVGIYPIIGLASHDWPFLSSAIDPRRPMWDSEFSEGTRRKQMPVYDFAINTNASRLDGSRQ